MGGLLCLNTCADNRGIRQEMIRKFVFFPPQPSYLLRNNEVVLLDHGIDIGTRASLGQQLQVSTGKANDRVPLIHIRYKGETE